MECMELSSQLGLKNSCFQKFKKQLRKIDYFGTEIPKPDF